MHQVGFAPAASVKVVRLTLAVLVAVGVFTIGLLSGPATASADSDVDNCSNGVVNVVCIGQINGNPVTVNVSDVLSADNLTVMTTGLQNVFLSVVNIEDINIRSADLTAQVQTLVRTVFQATTKTYAAFVTPPAAVTDTSVITITCS
jgi:hypothetical protein